MMTPSVETNTNIFHLCHILNIGFPHHEVMTLDFHARAQVSPGTPGRQISVSPRFPITHPG